VLEIRFTTIDDEMFDNGAYHQTEARRMFPALCRVIYGYPPGETNLSGERLLRELFDKQELQFLREPTITQ
jgi:hypothetical protein